MLKQIYIENFALIDSLELEPDDGFTVFTGETGSGKSILIDAISFALGKRADKTFVRKGKEKATIELTFFVGAEALDLLKPVFDTQDIDCEDGVIYIRRQIYADGRSISKVNSKNVNISTLKTIASYLVNIHGQNEFNELGDQNQINILDAYIKMQEQDVYRKYNENYGKYVALKKQYEKLTVEFNKDDNNTQLELVNYKINEIKQLHLKKGEDEKIQSKLEIAEQSQRITDAVSGLYDELYGNSSNVMRTLKSYMDEFEKFAGLDEKLSSVYEKINSQYYNIEDLAYELRDMLGIYEYEDGSVQELESRFDEINTVFSKYAQGYDDLMDYLKDLEKKKNELENTEVKIKELKGEIENIKKLLTECATEITKIRAQKKSEFEKDILKELSTLGMNSVDFRVQIGEQKSFTSKGLDTVLFLISFNKGEDVKPFSKVASGGEISRFMLSLKNVISSDYEKTMIFDEIDTGISGLASERVGNKMKAISAKRQVLCITHQAQIASYATNHIEVYKTQENESTLTHAKKLNEDERIRRIALMMDASADTKAIEHAKQLIKKNAG